MVVAKYMGLMRPMIVPVAFLLGFVVLNPAWGDYLNPNDPLEDRVNDLVSRMSRQEKISQLAARTAPGIGHLGIQSFNWWAEALHGLDSYFDDNCTCFPSAIGLGSSWNPDLLEQVGDVISTESRISYHYNGWIHEHDLSYFSPVNVNLARDPRWGRTEEVFAEDPLLQGKLGVGVIHGMHGKDDSYLMPAGDVTYLKTLCTVKHFVANNSEYNRHHESNNMTERDLREHYLEAFRLCAIEGEAEAFMSAYNAVNGVPCSVDSWLLTDVLRNEWGFDGYVTSDCGAVENVWRDHHYYPNADEAAGYAMKAGVDLSCFGGEFTNHIGNAINLGIITEADLDRSIKRLFRARIRLGEFDPPGTCPYQQLDPNLIDSQQHRDIAREAARQSLVLMKNEGNLLPLDASQMDSIVLVGRHAIEPQNPSHLSFLGGYTAKPSYTVSTKVGVENLVGSQVTVRYAMGMGEFTDSSFSFSSEEEQWINAADAVVVVVGTDNRVIGESRDKTFLELYGAQESMIQWVRQRNPNTIVLLYTAVPLAINWTADNVPAIAAVWYFGQEGGNAVAEMLFGQYNPGGKLTMTWYRSVNDLPAFNDYYIIGNNRTYMYFTGTPLYPFGHGLSYTQFAYSNLQVPGSVSQGGGSFNVSVDVQNTGSRRGDEVVQLYIHDVQASVPVPIKKLVGFDRITLEPGEQRTVNFTVNIDQLGFWDVNTQQFMTEYGTIDVMAGSSSADIRLSDSLEIAPPIPAPTLLSVTPLSGSTVEIVWQDNSHGDQQEDSFLIQRKPYGRMDTWQQVGEVGADVTTYTDTDNVHGLIEYRYRVGAHQY